MKNYVKPIDNFEDALRQRGFEIYGVGGGNANWIAKTDNGYLTLTCDGDDTALEWIPKDGVNLTDDEFINAMIGDAAEYDELWNMYKVVNLNVLELLFSGV